VKCEPDTVRNAMLEEMVFGQSTFHYTKERNGKRLILDGLATDAPSNVSTIPVHHFSGCAHELTQVSQVCLERLTESFPR
jgi:hypothetical protein